MKRSLWPEGCWALLAALVLGACGSTTDVPPLDIVLDTEVSVEGAAATVSWTASARAESYRVTLTGPGQPTQTRDVAAGTTSVIFSELVLGVTYNVQVVAMRGAQLAAADPVSFRVPDPFNDMLLAAQAGIRTSLHGTADGMKVWYEHPDGLAHHGGPAYAQLMCSTCHAFNASLTGVSADAPCLACHPPVEAGSSTPNYSLVSQSQCLKCHSRQAAEIAMNLPDVHRAAGMQCVDCHPGDQVHGSGSPNEKSMFDVMKVECGSCHRAGGSAPPPPNTSSHMVHLESVACQSCHMSGSVTCYNCHLKDEIVAKKKTAYARYADWLFLGNYRGKVHPLNFQSVEYEGVTFNAWGPFTGHTITREGRMCGYCHGAANVKAVAAGTFNVTRWDPTTSTMWHATGVVPVTTDYRARLRFDFVTKDATGSWTFVETGPEKSQMLYATPLTAAQLARFTGSR